MIEDTKATPGGWGLPGLGGIRGIMAGAAALERRPPPPRLRNLAVEVVDLVEEVVFVIANPVVHPVTLVFRAEVHRSKKSVGSMPKEHLALRGHGCIVRHDQTSENLILTELLVIIY